MATSMFGAFDIQALGLRHGVRRHNAPHQLRSGTTPELAGNGPSCARGLFPEGSARNAKITP